MNPVSDRRVRELMDLEDAGHILPPPIVDGPFEVEGSSDPDYGFAHDAVERLADDLTAAGYQWVEVTDSFPEDTETWMYLGTGDLAKYAVDADD